MNDAKESRLISVKHDKIKLLNYLWTMKFSKRSVESMEVKTKVALITPFAPAVKLFRKPLLKLLVERSYETYIFAPDWTEKLKEETERDTGAISVEYPLNRAGINPLRDFFTVISLVKLFTKLKPDVAITFQPKPNIYGMLAAGLKNVKRRFAVVEGLGFAFTEGERSLKKRIIQKILAILYKTSFKFANKVFFLNPDDLNEFVTKNIIEREKAVLLGPIGVPLEEFHYEPPALKPITFTLIGRILKEKGVLEFVQAARIVKRKYPDVRFLLIGMLDTNPGAVTEEEIRSWITEGIIEWIQWVDDVKPYIKQTSVYVLPSYREGVPRSTQEAMAMGRPVITTDVPGCRETVINNVNGFLVPPKNVLALTQAMEKFIKSPNLIEKMGKESRKIAEEKFNVKLINERFLKELGL